MTKQRCCNHRRGEIPTAAHRCWEVARALGDLREDHPVEMRLLTPEQDDWRMALIWALHNTGMRLSGETKPAFTSGQRVVVHIVGDCDARTPTPKAGTIGVVDRVEWDVHFGWWIVVAVRRPYYDRDGTQWLKEEGKTDPRIRFKSDELRKAGGRPVDPKTI